MIDIHTHILPAVDDGAASIQTALEMLKIAEADGIHTIVATPHTFSNISTYKSLEQLREKFLELKSAASQQGLHIEILQGAENFFDSRLADYLRQNPEMLTINNSDYFLLEFPPDFIFPGTRQFIYNVMQDGYIPIICHVERNRVFRQNPLLLYQFLEMGALAQATAGSFRGDFGSDVRTTALEFVKANMIHVIASDSHHSRYRQPQMSFVYEELKEAADTRHIDLLTTGIPSAIIKNEAVPDTGPMKDPSHRPSMFDFFINLFQRQ